MKRPFQDSVTELLWTIPALGLTLALSATAALASWLSTMFASITERPSSIRQYSHSS